MTDNVLVAVEDGIRYLTLNRPHRLNAINPRLVAELGSALADGNADPGTRAMVLRGAGRAFCAGDDLKDFEQQVESEAGTRAYIDSIQEVTRQIIFGDKFVIGAIHGWAVGGGLEWVINCDLVVMAEGTRCFFPEISLGVFVTGAVTALLPRLVGLPKAKEMILLGEHFDAGAALEMGIACKVVAPEDLPAAAEALARRVAALPEDAVRDLKRIITLSSQATAEEAMDMETDATVRGFLDPGTARRVAAFGKD